MTVLQRNNVKVIGSGQKVLMFAHGYGCDQNMWRHVWPEFAEEYEILMFDYAGSGLSDSSSFDRTQLPSEQPTRGDGSDRTLSTSHAPKEVVRELKKFLETTHPVLAGA